MEEIRHKFISKLSSINNISIDITPLYDSFPSGYRYEMPVLIQIVAG
jgi:hypothetical protein